MKKKTTSTTNQNTTQNTTSNTNQTNTGSTNQNTTQNINQTTSAVNPEWVTQGVQGQQTDINNFFKNFDPSSLAPGANPLQTQAGQGAASLSVSPNFQQATDILGRVAGAGPQSMDRVDMASLIPQFMNPYTKDVVDSSLANFDFGTGQAVGQANLDLAGDPTFGGSGGALLKRGILSDAVRNRAQLEAGLRSDAFKTAAGLAGQQAGLDMSRNQGNAGLVEQALARQGQAAGGIADIGASQGDAARANAGVQANIGEMLRQILAAQGKAPLDALQAKMTLLGSLPYDLFHGQNTTGTNTGSLTGTSNDTMTGTSTGTATGTLSGTTKGTQSGASLGDWLSYMAANARAAASGG